MRNTRQRAIFLALAIVAIVALSWRRDTILRAEVGAKSLGETLRNQLPLQFTPPTHDAEKAAPPGTAGVSTTHEQQCDVDLPRLTGLKQRYSLEDRFEYYKRYVKFTRQGDQRRSMTKLDQPFVPDQFRTIDLSKKKQYDSEACPAPLEVAVPESPFPTTVNASDFIFGVSTTYKRLVEPNTSPINEWSYWLTDGRGNSNGGKLILLLLGATDDELESVTSQLRGVGIDVDTYHSDGTMEMAVRYLTIIPTLYNHPSRQSRKWIVTCDDDTFFPNMHALVDKMATFEASEMVYAGTLSEDAFAVERHGSQAFGGAGVFISTPLAAKITELYPVCRSAPKVTESDSGWGAQGDILLRKCIYEHTSVRLSYLSDLWQMDIIGDPAGFYESGVKPLSVHHYGGGWHRARPYQTTKIAHVCGEDCALMRFRTADDFVISNGYSVAWYPDGADEVAWNQVERTFAPLPDDRGWNFDYKMGPQRPRLHQTGKKLAWELMESSVNADGSVIQVYVRKRDDWRWTDRTGQRMSDIDGIVELVWIP